MCLARCERMGINMRKLSFKRGKKRFDLEILKNVLIWLFKIAIVCLLAFVLVWYFGQRVSNIGDSMNPVLKNGDIVLVNTIVYDASTPKRGDIIVFKPNGNENSHFYIKRIVGLPGETVEIQNGEIFIDGEKLEENYKTTSIEETGIAEEAVSLRGDEYFVLGDNRLSSEDSRMADIGNVKKSEIEGKAWFIVSPGKDFGFIS